MDDGIEAKSGGAFRIPNLERFESFKVHIDSNWIDWKDDKSLRIRILLELLFATLRHRAIEYFDCEKALNSEIIRKDSDSHSIKCIGQDLLNRIRIRL